MSQQTVKLKALLQEGRILTAPAAFDALSAKIIERIGFDIVWVSGASLTNAYLGNADVGILSYGEIRNVIQNITNAVSIPVIVDVDTGYGGILNAYRMVQEFEAIGVAGIQIEDQTFPKRCAYFSGVSVVEVQEMEKRLSAVLKARKSKDFMIIARTDAGKSLGFAEAIRRAKLYHDMGADMLFISAPEKEEEVYQMMETGLPLCTAVVEGSSTEAFGLEQLQKMGFLVAKYPQTMIRASMCGMVKVLEDLKKTGESKESKGFVVSAEKRNELTDLALFNRLEQEITIRQ